MGDSASIADSSMSAVTSKSKCGATNKHCTVEGCSTKKVVDGKNWGRHVKSHTDKGMPKNQSFLLLVRVRTVIYVIKVSIILTSPHSSNGGNEEVVHIR